ncbi:hypothetical protein QFC21_001081 [Naganishia friedmannii]|uniref:Uncharacterized protein n=1 Tax=Naganishia friedmannii TaxID=89922 RepID=A0ACC2W9U5_9TREE|nr:hypothetical protein QFC21_001081 [Naganishia friedmannii]
MDPMKYVDEEAQNIPERKRDSVGLSLRSATTAPPRSVSSGCAKETASTFAAVSTRRQLAESKDTLTTRSAKKDGRKDATSGSSKKKRAVTAAEEAQAETSDEETHARFKVGKEDKERGGNVEKEIPVQDL